MIKHNQDGAVNAAVLSLVFTILLLIGAIVFGGWAYSSRQDYKNNTDQKIHLAVTLQQNQDAITEKNTLAQDLKQPLDTYNGPAQYGSIILKYPRTWSALVDSSGTSGSTLIDGYFAYPILPSLTDQTSMFALRFQVLNQTYATSVQNVINQSSQTDPIASSAYSLPSLKNVVGVEVSGTLPNILTGTATMVILPLRADTIELWTVGPDYLNDFNNIILPNFTFSP